MLGLLCEWCYIVSWILRKLEWGQWWCGPCHRQHVLQDEIMGEMEW